MGSNSENATCCNEYNQLNIKLYHRGVTLTMKKSVHHKGF